MNLSPNQDNQIELGGQLGLVSARLGEPRPDPKPRLVIRGPNSTLLAMLAKLIYLFLIKRELKVSYEIRILN